MDQNVTIAPSEWELMRLVWTKKTITSREIINLMQQKRDWSDSTIKTLLNRLVKKGLLSTEKTGNRFVYRATVEEVAAMDHETQMLFDQLCSMKVGTTVAHLLKHLTLTQKDIADLQAILDQKATTAPETVACNCLPMQCHCD